MKKSERIPRKKEETLKKPERNPVETLKKRLQKRRKETQRKQPYRNPLVPKVISFMANVIRPYDRSDPVYDQSDPAYGQSRSILVSKVNLVYLCTK